MRAIESFPLLTVFALLALLAACDDMVRSSYSTVDDARRQGAITNGWIPGIVPDGSVEIREVHNIDTNEVWGEFTFPPKEEMRLRERLSVLGIPEVAKRKIRSPGVDWWPPILEGTLHEQDLSESGLLFYKSDGRVVVLFAVDWAKHRAYFWGTA